MRVQMGLRTCLGLAQLLQAHLRHLLLLLLLLPAHWC